VEEWCAHCSAQKRFPLRPAPTSRTPNKPPVANVKQAVCTAGGSDATSAGVVEVRSMILGQFGVLDVAAVLLEESL
jgi:hypothetical protein